MCATCGSSTHIVDAGNRIDPTGTTGIRKRFEADLVRRFRAIRTAIRDAVQVRDVLGLKSGLNAMGFMTAYGGRGRRVGDDIRPAPSFAFERDQQKVSAFMAWLDEQVASEVLGVFTGTPLATAADQSWMNVYITSAYRKGLQDAFRGDPLLAAAFNRPIHADRVGMIFTRSFSELKGIAEAMDSQISRVLATALIEGQGPMVTARRLADRVDKIGITRARVLARTETIAAHASGTLGAYREMQVAGVNLRAEWLTARDGSVCSICQALQGRVFTLDEAEGMLPRHPNCRCVWVAAVKGPGEAWE